MDIGSAVGSQKELVSEEELKAVSNWKESSLFSEKERTAIEYAEEMSKTPVRVSSELFERLSRHFDEEQIVELTSSIAYENYRARFNHALDIESGDFYGTSDSEDTEPLDKSG